MSFDIHQRRVNGANYGYLPSFLFIPADGDGRKERSRELTAEEIEGFETSWGREAFAYLTGEWMQEQHGPGYYLATIQAEQGVGVRLLGEAGERLELEEAKSPAGRRFNNHSNDIGDWCPWSGHEVPENCEDVACPAGCRASAVAEDNEDGQR